MPEKATIDRARQDLREGKSPTTAAGEFVREEIEHVRHGKHGARSARQAIAIGLSKARRAGVPLPVPKKGQVSEKTRRAAMRERQAGQHTRAQATGSSKKRARASLAALKREGRNAASKTALSRQTKRAAARRKQAQR